MEAATNGIPSAVETARRRPRTGKKRLKFGPPRRFARGVKELWKSATAEDQARAHHACRLILALWLGKRRREEVASELSIPRLRLWQLSQLALSGMLAGLLHQPRSRRRNLETSMQDMQDDPRRLMKLVAERDKQIADQQDLIRLLTSIPKPVSETSAREVPARNTKKRARRTARKREAGGGDAPVDAPPAPR